MKKVIIRLQKYLAFAAPFVLAVMIWGKLQPDESTRLNGSFLFRALWEALSWNLILWFAALLIFMLLLVFRKNTQEESIRFLVGIKERDEREQAIVGAAARRSFVTTTALLVFLLFMSCFTLTIARLPEQTFDGKKSSLSIGFQVTGTEVSETRSKDGQIIFEHRDLPLSKSALILIVLIWQVTSFRLKIRRDLRENFA